jgi:colanic acid/amylovoran biosynthesis glycosyltransferase
MAVRCLRDWGVPIRFDIIGEGPDRQRILYTVHDLDLQSDVHLLGKLSPEAIREVLRRSDIFLFSSLSEGISNAVLEAMACGVPVVTTDCGGMREVVGDGVEGFVVPTRDVKAIAYALRKLAIDAELRHQMGKAGRKRVLQEFSLEHQKLQFLKLYTSLLDGKYAAS